MWNRLILAGVGAAAITIAMLLGMSEVVELFTQRDPTRYYRVTDFIPGAGGRRRPELVLPEVQPRRATIEHDISGQSSIDELPNFNASGAISATPQPLRLDEPESAQPEDP